MEGMSLLELMPYVQDKDRLRSIINKSVMTSSVTDCIHLHMRDAYGSFVLVSALYQWSCKFEKTKQST